MNIEKHTPETLTELLERAKTLHINEGLGRKRDEITRLLDQCLEIADFKPYIGVGLGLSPIKTEVCDPSYTITTTMKNIWSDWRDHSHIHVHNPEELQAIRYEMEKATRLLDPLIYGRGCFYYNYVVQATDLRDHAEAEEV